MPGSHFFRLGKINGNNGVLEALKHNKRELQAERGSSGHIDVARALLNYSLTGSGAAKELATEAKVLMLRAGVERPRKNGVMAVEVVYSLPISRHQQDTKSFFVDCYEWTLKSFAGELLSFDVHLDESAPHAHAVILPLVDGSMQGNKMVGGIGNMTRLRNSFHKKVGAKHDLNRRNSLRLSHGDKKSIASAVLRYLKNDSVQQSVIYGCVRDAIVKDPIPFAQMLGLSVFSKKSKKSKSFVDIKRSKGKGVFIT